MKRKNPNVASGPHPRRVGLKALLFLFFLWAPHALGQDRPWRSEWEWPEADFRLDLSGYVHFDLSAYPNWEVLEDARTETAGVERLRLGVEGRWRRLSFELDLDLQEPSENVKDAYVELRLRKELRVRGGNFKPPFSLEFLTSPRRIDFIRRSLLADRGGPARDLGVTLRGELIDRLDYSVGVFAGDGRTRSDRAGTTAAGRVVVKMTKALDLGASFMTGDVEADPVSALSPVPKGIKGESATGFTFFERHFVSGERRRWDVEATFMKGPFGLKGEALRATEDRRGQGSTFDDLPAQVARGWALSGTWLVTGDKKKIPVEPRRPIPRGGGAIEVGVRYESLDFDDDGPDTGFAGAGDRARNIRPAGDRVLTAGVSWWPSAWMRFMVNALVESYRDPLLAPEPRRSGDYVSVLARLQFEIP